MSTFFPYTPRQETFEGLRACFVARQHLLNELLQSIREQSPEKNLQHWMIIGSRGLGKSHLIALIYHSIKQDSEFAARWVPLLMKEEEQGVFSLHTLFTRILTVLAEEVENDDPDRARQLVSYLSDLKKGNLSKEEILDGVLACIKDFTTVTKRKLLVLAENADDLLTRCVPKPNEIKQLRRILQHDSQLLLVATSPGQFGRISSSKAPLYQFFRIRNLELLSFEQALELLNCWFKMDPYRKEIEPFRRDDTKLRVLYHLTGGNPRILLFLYIAISGQGGIQRAVDIFSRLLEQNLSNYYISRMRDLTNQEQPIVIALAEADQSTLTQKEIARQTFLPQASIGTAMMRLESQGILRPVSGKKGKNTLYTLTDHLFRLWYRWRTGVRERKVIEALVEFLGIWYRRKELQTWSEEKGSLGIYCREALEFRSSKQFREYVEPFKEEAETELKERLDHRDYGGFFSTLSLLREWAGEEHRGHVDPLLKGISNGKVLEEALDYLTRRLDKDPDSSDAWVDAGILLDKKEDLAGAERAFSRAVELDPKNAHAWFHLGLVRDKQKNYAGSECAYAIAVELAPRDIDAWFNLGTSRWEQKDYLGAELAIEKAAELNPENTLSWLNLAAARRKQKNYAGAEQAASKAVEVNPKKAEAWLRMGLARESLGNHQGAEQAITKAVELNPKDAHVWFHLGLARGHQGNNSGAEQAFRMAVDLNPKGAAHWFNLGEARRRQKDFEGAAQAFEGVLQIDPKNARAWLCLGLAREKLGNHEGSEQSIVKAVELAPADAHNWFHLGLIRLDQENYVGAEQAFCKCLDLDAKKANVWFNLGEARRRQEKYAEAEQALERGLQINPKDPRALICLGETFEAQKKFAGAERAFERAAEFAPKNAVPWFKLAVARWNQGNRASAEQAAEMAVELNPNDYNSWLILGAARVSNEKYADAELALEKAIAIDPQYPSAWNNLVAARFGNYDFKSAWEDSIRAIDLGADERAYRNLVELYLTTEVGNPIPVLDRALGREQLEPSFRAFISLLHAMVSISMGDRTPFLKDLKRAAKILEPLEEEQRAEMLGEFMDLLVGVTYRHTLEKIDAYLAGLSQAVPQAASILTSLRFVMDYFKVYFSETQKKGPVGKQAEQVLDRAPSELRAPVEEMVRRVKKQQAWWNRRPKKSDGKE